MAYDDDTARLGFDRDSGKLEPTENDHGHAVTAFALIGAIVSRAPRYNLD